MFRHVIFLTIYKIVDMLKKFYGLMFLLMALFYSSCAAVETIFKAGMWWGIILVVGVIALIIFIIAKIGQKK